MRKKIQGGSFDESDHSYRNENGVWVPSCTQVIKLAGYSNFNGIDPLVVRNAARRGTNCHWWTEQYDLDGTYPPSWVPEEERIRFEGYVEWKKRENFIPTSVECPQIFSVYAMESACITDRVGKLNGQRAIVELKFTAKAEWYWGLQLAAQEIALTGSPQTGRYLRVVCHIDKTGKAKTLTYRDPLDSQKFIAALIMVWARIDAGQNVQGEVIGIEEEEE